MLRFILLFVGLLLLRVSMAQEVRLSEAMFRNEATLLDEDGDAPDWVELENYGSNAIDLTGWGLSDDPNEPFKWVFPNRVLAPGQTLIVFASDKNRFGDVLHTSFGIRHQQEGVYLAHPDSTLIDSIAPSCTPPGISIGKVGNGQALVHFDPPSPGSVNLITDTVLLDLDPDTVSFTHPPGFYEEAFELQLSGARTDTRLYYTFNGSVPDEEANLYTEALNIKSRIRIENDLADIPTAATWKEPQGDVFKINTIKVAPFRSGCRVGPVETNSYLVGNRIADRYPVPIVSLTVRKSDFFSDSRGIYVQGDNQNSLQKGRDWERDAHIEYFLQGGELVLEQDCGVRIHGLGSRSFPQKSLRLYAREDYGKATFDYPFFPQTTMGQFTRLVLRTAESDKINSLITDPLCHALVQNMDVRGQGFQPVVVFLNGEYWGVHNLRERQDEYFLASYTGYSKDSFDIIETTIFDASELSAGSEDHYTDLLIYANNNDLADPVHYAYVGTQMDIDNFIEYYVAELYFSNYDWPGNNKKFWRPQTQDGRWRWLFFDCDNCLNVLNLDHFRDFFAPDNEFTVYQPWATILIRNLLKNEDFRRQLQARMYYHMSESFTPEQFIRKLRAIRDIYTPLMAEHIQRWNSPESYPIWWRNTEELEFFALQRPAIMARQMNTYFQSPVKLYPNPVSENLQVLTNLNWETDATIEVYDALGNCIYRERRSGMSGFDDWALNCSELAPGIYVFRLEYGKVIFREKFIVAGS